MEADVTEVKTIETKPKKFWKYIGAGILGITLMILGGITVILIMIYNTPQNQPNSLADFSGVCRFTIPFETTNRYYSGDVIYFDTTLTYEQMQTQSVGTVENEYSFGSELLEVDGKQVLLITVEHKKGTSYFKVADVPEIADRLVISAVNPDDVPLYFGGE